MASVDVIVPCYNYARFLRGAVGSALSQHGVDVRVLILDDCSPDNTEEVGRALAEEDSRVEYRRHAVNHRHVATYNEGIDWAAADYLMVLSADDMLTQGALARATSLMDRHPEVGMTYGDVVRTDSPDFASVSPPLSADSEVIPGPEFIERTCQQCSNLVEAVTAVVRTSVQKHIGGYRKELPHTCDMEMWLRCASVSAIGRIKAPQGFYRRHGTNMSCGYVNRKNYDQVKAAFRYFFAESGERIPERDVLERLLNTNLARDAFYLANDAFDAGNSPLCDELLTEAKSLSSEISRHPGWRRLRIKRFFGARLWSVLRSLNRRRRSSRMKVA